MLDEPKELVKKVANGNPGALSILMSRELMWFSEWFKILQYLDENDIRGSKIWEQAKDEFNMNIHGWADSILTRMHETQMQTARPFMKF